MTDQCFTLTNGELGMRSQGQQNERTTERDMGRAKSWAQATTVARDCGRWKRLPTGGLKRTVNKKRK